MVERAPLPGGEASAGPVGHTRDRLKPRLQFRERFLLRRVYANPHAWLALLLVIPAMLPLFAPGYFFKAHDARHSVFFLVEFDQAFRAGSLWPVWGPDFAVGFGYPLWLVYGPLPYYVGQAFHLLGLGLTAAVKATWALGLVLGALGVYRLARRWWGPMAGVVASVAFTYAPYHLVQIYVRAALAEFMALAWLPWAVLALVALWEAPGPRRAAVAALAVTALLMLHTVSVVTFVPLVAGLILVLLARDIMCQERHSWPRALLWTGTSAALGGLLAAIFLGPMLLERGDIVEAQWVNATYNYRNHFVYPGQFIDPKWGFGYSVPGREDGMSFQLGLALLPAALIGALAAIVGAALKIVPSTKSHEDTLRGRLRAPSCFFVDRFAPLPHRAEALFLALVSVAALFLMTPASVWFWDTLPLMALVQFPWRLLAIEVFTLALLVGAGAHWLAQRSRAGGPRLLINLALTLVILLVSLPYVRAQIVPIRPQDETPLAIIEFELEFSDMRGMTRWSERVPQNADSPLIAQYLAGEPLRRAAIVAGAGEILAQEADALSVTARLRAEEPVRLRFYTYYFPGWRATLDGQPVEIAPDPPNGLIGLDVPAGEHEVVLRFGSTPIRRAATAISITALLIVAALALRGTRPGRAKLA